MLYFGAPGSFSKPGRKNKAIVLVNDGTARVELNANDCDDGAYSRALPQNCKSFAEFSRRVTPSYLKDVGITKENYESIVTSLKPPKKRRPLWWLEVKTEQGSAYLYLCTQVLDDTDFGGPTATVLKQDSGEWLLHGSDDIGLLMELPLDSFEKLTAWIRSKSLGEGDK
jgi:hypothetical protein